MKQKILIDIGGDLELKYFENSLQVIPAPAASAKVIIYDDGGAVKVALSVVSIDSAGTMSFAITAAIADDVYSNWKAVWQFVVNGNTIYKTTLFDVVRNILENPVIDEDIINAAAFLKEQNYNKIFTSDSGTSTTIISTELTEKDDYWNGGSAEVIDGINVGQIRKVTDFVASTTKLTVEAFVAAIDATSKIRLTRTFKKEIDRAFDRFKLDVKNRGIRIDRIIDDSQVKEYIIILSLHYICFGLSTDIADIWFAKAEAYMSDYKKLIGTAVFEYDDDNDGNIESDEEQKNIFQPKGKR